MSYSNNNIREVEANGDTFEARLERMFEWQDKNHKWPNVELLIRRPEGSHILKKRSLGANIVCDTGDVYYARKAGNFNFTGLGEEDFGSNGRFELRTGTVTPLATHTYTNVTTPITASRKIFDTGYPQSNNQDTDNTGKSASATTYKTTWSTGDFAATGIIGGCIHASSSPTGATKLLSHFSVASDDKTSADSATIWLNHLFNAA